MARGALDRIFGSDEESVFLDSQVPNKIMEIVTGASNQITLVTPYLGLWVHLKNAMEEAIARGVSIVFVVRAGEQKQSQDLVWLKEHRVHVYEVPSLHAKIYLNERNVLVSSMNIYGSSAINSLDFALMVRDEDEAAKLRDYVTHMIDKFSPTSQALVPARPPVHQAFCIRDGKKIEYDVSKPLCEKCYSLWKKYENKEYPEAYCHSCGRKSETSFSKPLCLDCYKRRH